MTALSLRLLAGWLSVQRLRRRAHQPADENWQALLRRLAERLRVTRPVKLVESALVEVPAVIGWLRPVILLPASAMTGLTTEQLEALLAHELAHVRRHDYLINLLQTVVETLLFYHPAVWWVSHRIRVEREHCCDDLAASVCGDRLSYAQALVAMEELRAPKIGLVMSSSGGSLLTRVARLIDETEQQRRPTGLFTVLLSLVSLTMAGALGAGLLTPPQKPTEGLPDKTEQKNEETSRANANDPVKESDLAMRVRQAAAALSHGRLELALEQEIQTTPSAEKPNGEVVKTSATARWIGEEMKWRVENDRTPVLINNEPTNKDLPHRWSAGFDGKQHYFWDRDAKQIELGLEFEEALQYSPTHLFWGLSPSHLQTLLSSPEAKTSAMKHQGLNCIRVDVEVLVRSTKQRYLLMICPERGYLPLEVRMFRNDRAEAEGHFSDFFEPRTGVWAPRKTHWKWTDPANPYPETPIPQTTFNVTRLELGEEAKLQADEFRVDPPVGTKLIEPKASGDRRSGEAAGSGDPRRAQTMTEVQRAQLALLRKRAENDINIRFAEKSAEVAKAEWEKMVEANRKVPGSIPATEIARAIRDYNNAVLKIEKAQHEQRIHQLELELALGQNKEDGLELIHKTLELRWLRAKAAADLAKAEHDRIIDANRRVPGTIPEAEVAKARMADEAARSQLERGQIEFQIAAELTKMTEMAFTDTPLADVVSYLSDYHNIPVVLDPTAQKFADSPVTVNVTGADLAECVMLVSHPHPLSYCIDGGRLLIATPEEVQRLGHKLPRSFADELAVLLKAEATIAWESLLRGKGADIDFAVIVPKLSKLLDSNDVTVQRGAARVLAELHRASAPARPGLEKLTKSPDARVAQAAWFALVAIGREDFSTLPLMLAELDRNGKVFGRIWLLLLRQFDEQVWAELAKVFPTSSPTVRATLASSVRLHSNSSLPVSLLALDDPDPRVRRTALRNIHREELPAKLLSALQARMKDSEHDIRMTAAQCLLSFETGDATAIDLLLSEVEQPDPGRSLVALQQFLLMGQNGMRPTINALDLPSRTGTEARKFAARRALAIIASRDFQWADGSTWGPTRAGLRTRLSLIPSEMADGKPLAPRVGQPIKLQLELTNIGKEPFEYDAQQAGVNQSLTVLDPDGRSVKYIGLQYQTAGTAKTIQPRETQVIVETLDLTAQYDIQRPGTYLIQWTRGASDIKPDDTTTPFVPNSNVLTLEVQEAERNRDKPDAKKGDLRSGEAAGSGDPRRAPAAKRNSVRERLQNRISLSLENVPLSQVVEHIGREAKIAVRLDSDALENDAIPEDTPVSISVDGISIVSALHLLLQPLQLSYLIEDETLVVTTAARDAKTPVEEQLDLGKTLADEVKMGLLREAIHAFVEPKEWDVAGGSGSIRCSGSIRFSASRKEFTVRHVSGIQYEVKSFLQHFLPRQITPESQRLRKLLSQRITMELGEVTLRDALRKIAIATDTNVVLDANGLFTVGGSADRRVTLNHKDTPLRDILDGLCKPLKLRFLIRHDHIQITDEETAQGGFIAVLYPISIPADDLANRIQKSIRPESWKSAGGHGTIEPHRPTDSLIIRQREDVHDEIEQFFAKQPAQDLKSQISNLKSQISDPKANAVKPAAQLKGQIRWIEKTQGMVWINLGQSDGVARPMRFQVREKADPKNGNQPQAVKGKIEVSRVIDGHTSEARIILDDQNNAVAKGDEIVQLFETTQPNDKPNEEQRKLPPPKGEIYDAASPGTDRIKPKQGSVSGAISGKRRDRDPEMLDQFTGRVRLKTEKPLPDLEKVIVPAGKVLDESLVFSKDGGLANVFVYLQKPTFPIEPPPSNRPPKPFILIAEGGKFWPHAAFVRVGRPIVFENRQTDLVNFFMDPQRNVSFNVVAKLQDQVKLQALRNSENFPFAVKSTIQPWMQAHLLTLDHPFAAVTDEDGRFTIDGLPPGEHEFRVWHERVGWLEKSLMVTIKPGEESHGDLQYEPARLKLVEAEVENWSNRHIDTQRGPQPRVPRRAAPQPVVKPKDAEAEAANRRVRGALQMLTEVAFTDTPFSDVLIYLGDYHNIAIKFDASLQEQLQDLRVVPITIAITGDDLEATLLRILHLKRLTYFVDAGELRIATPEEVRRLGHLVPESFAETLVRLEKADSSVPWERFLLGREWPESETRESCLKHVETLTKLLSNPNAVVQRHAASVLTRFDEAAVQARPALEKLTKSENRSVRQAAWQTLLAIGRQDLSTWPLFLEAWNNQDEYVREQWIVTLLQFHPRVFDELVVLFPTSSVEFRRACSASLRFRRERPSYEQLSILAMADDDEETRYLSLRHASSEAPSQPFLSSWRRRLKDDSPRCRVVAASYLLPLESDRLDALEVLLDEIGTADTSRWPAAAQVIAAFATHDYGGQFRDRLLRRSVSGDEVQRTVARKALKFVPESKSHLAILQEIDAQLENVREAQRFPLAKRLELLDELGRDRMNPKGSEELRSRVGHHLAHYFAKWDLVAHNARVREYSLAALKLDVDADRRASLFSLVGSAALVDPAVPTFVEQRRNAAKLWLTGYREVVSLKLPKAAPDVAAVVLKIGDIDGESPEQRADRVQQLAAQLKARQEAEFIGRMVEHRHQLARLCVETYQRDPADDPELRKLATESLTDKSLVDALFAEGAVPLGAAPDNSRPQ